MNSGGSFATRRFGLTLLAVGVLGTPAGLFLVLKLFPRLDVIFQNLDFQREWTVVEGESFPRP